MPSINIFSGETFKKKFANYMAVGLTGLAIGLTGLGIVKGLPKYAHNRECKHNVSYILKTIDSKNFELADSLINLYKKNRTLREDHRIWLSQSIMQEKEKMKAHSADIKKFEEALETNNLDNMYSACNKLAPSSNTNELAYFDSRINKTEAGLLKLIKNSQIFSDDETMDTLCSDYLRLYQFSENKKEIIEKLMIARFEKLDKLPASEFEQKYAQLSGLNALMEKYSEERINLSDVVPMDKFTDNSENYLRDALIENRGTTIRIGDMVKISPSANFPNVNDNYIYDRNINFAKNSAGLVIDKAHDWYVIRFEDTKKCLWSKNWKLVKKYWKDNERNAGAYISEELIPLKHIDEIQKNLYRREIRKLDDSFSKYYHGGK